MSRASLRVIGDDKIQHRLKLLLRLAPGGMAAAMRAEAEAVMRDSKRNYCPVAFDGGALRASGKVGRARISKTLFGVKVEVPIGYGGPSAPYAEALHEHPSGASPPSWHGKVLKFHLGPPTKSEGPTPSGGSRTKYLERPLMAAQRGLPKRAARRIGLGRMMRV